MINYLRHMAIFSTVVDEGSFRAAAKKLSLAPSRVSEMVSGLEKYLGVTLLNRSTRKLSLTNEGRGFYAHVVEILRNAEAGLNELNMVAGEPVGELRISLPAFLARSAIASAIAEFVNEHKKVSVSLVYTDQVMDMLAESLDLSIRVGWLKNSSMMSRKLGHSRRLLVAGKAYAQSKAVPDRPADLVSWDWIRFSIWPNSMPFESQLESESISIADASRITVNSAEALLHIARQNAGLTILPEYLVKEHLKTEELVHVLPDWKLKSLGYYAVWPDQSRRENLTLLLVRFLADRGLSVA